MDRPLPQQPMTATELLAKARARFGRVSPASALEEQRHGALLVDTRSVDAIGIDGGIPGAYRVALSVLPWRVDPASPWAIAALTNRTARIIVLCQGGYSSSLAVEWLLDLGFERATDVEGGVTAWIEAGLPLEPSDGTP